MVDQVVQEESDKLEEAVLATVQGRPGVRVVTWEAVRSAGLADQTYLALLEALGSQAEGWIDGVGGPRSPLLAHRPAKEEVWEDLLKDYNRYKDQMSPLQGVALYKGRIVVPRGLCGAVLKALHRDHQGTTGMSLRAGEQCGGRGLQRICS